MSFYEFAAAHPWLSTIHAILAIVGLATVGGEIRRAIVKLARVQAGRAARIHEMSLAHASAAKDDTEDEIDTADGFNRARMCFTRDP